MKRKTIVTALALLGVMLACPPTIARSECFDRADGDVIPVKVSIPSIDPESPRSPIMIPVSVFLDTSAGTLNLYFLFPVGDITITLTEISTGAVSSGSYSTSLCCVSVPVVLGTYEFSILLDNGVEYVGQFSI